MDRNGPTRAQRPWRATLRGVVVALDGESVLLQGAGAAVWTEAEPGVEDLAASVRAAWPELDDDAITSAIDELCDAGLLVR